MMQAHQAIGYTGVAIFYLGHISADFIWYGLVSVVVGTTRRFIAEKPYRIIIMFLGGTLIFFGGQFVCQALTKWF
jgi:arginine exporter protein ArgO